MSSTTSPPTPTTSELAADPIDIRICARCQGPHYRLAVKPLTRPTDEWTHFAVCPVLNEPVFVRYATSMIGKRAVTP